MIVEAKWRLREQPPLVYLTGNQCVRCCFWLISGSKVNLHILKIVCAQWVAIGERSAKGRFTVEEIEQINIQVSVVEQKPKKLF